MCVSAVIRVNNVSKKFRLYDSHYLRALEFINPFNKTYHKEFWALRNIDCEIRSGEVIGLLGRNGSGKSTLLQIISGVMHATSGDINVNGRLTALLELGAGFKPDLTGEENAILNGILHGATEREMRSRMEHIVEYSGIGDFITQPVSTYSSGMFVRLAFSSMLGLDPDILIVDEALSVGDAEFQNRCFSTITEYRRAGKTIIFVTHDTRILYKIADRVLLLDNGNLIKSGKPKEVINYYETLVSGSEIDNIEDTVEHIDVEHKASNPLSLTSDDRGTKRRFRNKSFTRLTNKKGELLDYVVMRNRETMNENLQSGERLDLYLKYRFDADIDTPCFGLGVFTVEGINICSINTCNQGTRLGPIKAGEIRTWKCSLTVGLLSGDYFVNVGITEYIDGRYEHVDVRRSFLKFTVAMEDKMEGIADLNIELQDVSALPTEKNCYGQGKAYV